MKKKDKHCCLVCDKYRISESKITSCTLSIVERTHMVCSWEVKCGGDYCDGFCIGFLNKKYILREEMI